MANQKQKPGKAQPAHQQPARSPQKEQPMKNPKTGRNNARDVREQE